MKRTILAIAVAGLTLATVSVAAQAAPIAPLAGGVTAASHGTVTKVWWHHHGWCYWHPWRCR